MLMHVIAHGGGGREGVRKHGGECALKVDFGRKIPCLIGESNLPERRAGPTFYQLSYIPAPFSACRFGSSIFPTAESLPPSRLYGKNVTCYEEVTNSVLVSVFTRRLSMYIVHSHMPFSVRKKISSSFNGRFKKKTTTRWYPYPPRLSPFSKRGGSHITGHSP